MTGEIIGFRQIKKSRRDHVCFWCGEKIEKGSAYDRWVWVDSDFDEIKVHPECRQAWNEASDADGYGIYETGPYEHERGKTRNEHESRQNPRDEASDLRGRPDA